MNILVIGSGGREHALTKSISESHSAQAIFASPGNPGILKYSKKAIINLSNHPEVINFCRENFIDLVVIGPEQPLAEGLSDALRALGIPVFGPSRAAAMLETSKNFAKEIMFKYNIPTAGFRTFKSHQVDEAHKFIDDHSLPVVLKADGLAAGKGVIIAFSHKEAHKGLNAIFRGEFGDSGNSVVIEEFMQGEETSIFAICDGTDYMILPASQDHKRIYDGDKGKNTGGMGAYAPALIVNETIMDKIKSKIIEPMLKAMQDNGTPYIGCLYAGLMINNNEPKVVEFNVRFGDPETQAVLNLIEGDFAKLLYSSAAGKIDKTCIEIKENTFSTCVIMASKGYPDDYKKGFEISGIEDAESTGAIIYHAGTSYSSYNLWTAGGRVLGVTGIGNSLKQSINHAYKAVALIDYEGKYFRKDIGSKGLKRGK
jgi:phosphoribosylamine--glycine ligase